MYDVYDVLCTSVYCIPRIYIQVYIYRATLESCEKRNHAHILLLYIYPKKIFNTLAPGCIAGVMDFCRRTVGITLY